MDWHFIKIIIIQIAIMEIVQIVHVIAVTVEEVMQTAKLLIIPIAETAIMVLNYKQIAIVSLEHLIVQ